MTELSSVTMLSALIVRPNPPRLQLEQNNVVRLRRVARSTDKPLRPSNLCTKNPLQQKFPVLAIKSRACRDQYDHASTGHCADRSFPRNTVLDAPRAAGDGGLDIVEEAGQPPSLLEKCERSASTTPHHPDLIPEKSATLLDSLWRRPQHDMVLKTLTTHVCPTFDEQLCRLLDHLFARKVALAGGLLVS